MRLKKLPKKDYETELLISIKYNAIYSSERNIRYYYTDYMDGRNLEYIPRSCIESPYRQYFILFKNIFIAHILLFGHIRKNPNSYEFTCYLVS
jgi:hypothetical protein